MNVLIQNQRPQSLPNLENGDHLNQKTFHERYEAMPEDCRAELIGGIVYMASPQKLPHGKAQTIVSHCLGEYVAGTPGTETLENTTQILGPNSEPQPDACLFILPEYGGQVSIDEELYPHGPPELIVEVSWATESIDLNSKKNDYEKAGVCEYVVLALRMERVFWFIRQRGKYKEMATPKDGIFHSRIFPGLRLDSKALLTGNRRKMLTELREGLVSPKHDAFVSKLEKRRPKK